MHKLFVYYALPVQIQRAMGPIEGRAILHLIFFYSCISEYSVFMVTTMLSDLTIRQIDLFRYMFGSREAI